MPTQQQLQQAALRAQKGTTQAGQIGGQRPAPRPTAPRAPVAPGASTAPTPGGTVTPTPPAQNPILNYALNQPATQGQYATPPMYTPDLGGPTTNPVGGGYGGKPITPYTPDLGGPTTNPVGPPPKIGPQTPDLGGPTTNPVGGTIGAPGNPVNPNPGMPAPGRVMRRNTTSGGLNPNPRPQLPAATRRPGTGLNNLL